MRKVVSLILILLAVGCTDKDNAPSGIIPREKMEKVLWDMIQADQYSALFLVKDSLHINVKAETQKLYQQVFQLHDVSREEFKKSFQYYLERPAKTRGIFDSLLAEGNRQRTESYKNQSPISRAMPQVTVPSPPPIVPVGSKPGIHPNIPGKKPSAPKPSAPKPSALKPSVNKPSVLKPSVPKTSVPKGSVPPPTVPSAPGSAPAGIKKNNG